MNSIACQAICLLAVCFELLPPSEVWAAHEAFSKTHKRLTTTPGHRPTYRPFRGDHRLNHKNPYRLKRPPQSTNTTLLTTMLPQDEEENLLLLWLPYVIFTIVLLSLIFMSFVRFHFQRGDQNRRRREELEDKPVLNGGKPPVDSTAMLEKGSDGWDRYPTITKTIPDHLSLFLQFSQTEDDDTPRKSALKKSDSGQFYDTKKISSDEPSICSGSKFKRSYRSKMPALHEPSVAFADKTSSRKNMLAIAELVPKSKNVAFTFNANGSMVDVRCTEEERSSTFRIHEKADINHNNFDYRSGLEFKSASLSSKGSKRKRLDNAVTQSLERHAFKSNSLSRNASKPPRPFLSNVNSVDYSNYPTFRQLVNSSHISQYQPTPMQLTPLHPPSFQPHDISPHVVSSTTSVRMVDAATSPGLALKRHNHHSPFHTLQSPLRDCPGEG